MDIRDKYEWLKGIYETYYIASGIGHSYGIPLEYIDFDENVDLAALDLTGSTIVSGNGVVGDGTVNIANHLRWLLCREDNGEDVSSEVSEVCDTLDRLSDTAYDMFHEKWLHVTMPEEPGFFVRDDVTVGDASNFHLTYVTSGWKMEALGVDDDPCYSLFTSQDQLWHLLPQLHDAYTRGYTRCGDFALLTLDYLLRCGHVIYNPYLSALKHHWTYYDLSVERYSRVGDRDAKLEYDIPVKRGADNRYYAYAFKRAYMAFDGDVSWWKRTWAAAWYWPFTFLADRVWWPLVSLFGGTVKRTAVYSMPAIDAKAWYGTKKGYVKRLARKFEASLEGGGDPFCPEIATLVCDGDSVDMDKCLAWLEDYEWDCESSPVTYLMIYAWYARNKGG